jgi:NaMN:DMB phosphoribosyltransferase
MTAADGDQVTEPPDRVLPALEELAPTVYWWAEATDSPRLAGVPTAVLGENIEVVSGGAPADAAAAAAVCGLLTGTDAATTTSTVYAADGTIDHNAWMTACSATRDELTKRRSHKGDPDLLRAELPAGLAALVDRLCDDDARPALLDGPQAAAAALLAYELNPDCLQRIRPLQKGDSAIEQLAWDYLRIPPVLPVHTRLSAGELGPAAVFLINSACGLARDAVC